MTQSREAIGAEVVETLVDLIAILTGILEHRTVLIELETQLLFGQAAAGRGLKASMCR